MSNMPAEAPQTAQDARNDARAIEDTAPTLTQHARALADELRGGPVAAALLAMANANTSQAAQIALLRAEVARLLPWRARAARWKRAAKAQREVLGEARAAAELANGAWGRERQRRRIAEAAWRGPYRVGVVDEASGLHYAGATFTHEVYDASGDPCEPIASCDTPEQAARLVALLNRYEATLDRTRIEREAWYWQAMQTPVREVRETWQAREGERE